MLNYDIVDMKIKNAVQEFGLALAKQFREQAIKADKRSRTQADTTLGHVLAHDVQIQANILMSVNITILDALKVWDREQTKTET